MKKDEAIAAHSVFAAAPRHTLTSLQFQLQCLLTKTLHIYSGGVYARVSPLLSCSNFYNGCRAPFRILNAISRLNMP